MAVVLGMAVTVVAGRQTFVRQIDPIVKISVVVNGFRTMVVVVDLATSAVAHLVLTIFGKPMRVVILLAVVLSGSRGIGE